MCVSSKDPLKIDTCLNIYLSIFLYFLLKMLCLECIDKDFCFGPLGGSLSYKEEILPQSKLSVTEDSSFVLFVIEGNALKWDIAQVREFIV